MLTLPMAGLLSLIIVSAVLWLINGYIPVPEGKIKTVLNVVLGLIVVGIGLWLINTYVPMAGVIKGLLNIVVVIATCVGVLQAFGLWDSVLNMGRKIRNHRWSHPEQDQPPATERVATEKPVVEKPAAEKPAAEKAPTVTVESTRAPIERTSPPRASNDKSAGEKADVSDPSVTVIVK
jgi:hypothetical protein